MSLALSSGAVLNENMPVESIQGDVNRVRINTASHDFSFDSAILTAGSWLPELVPELRAVLKVTQQYYAYFDSAEPNSFAPERFPVWIDADSLMYGFPRDGEQEGVKIASHVPGAAVSPSSMRSGPTEADCCALASYAGRRLPWLGTQPLLERTCLYTNTPDEEFIVDCVPGLPNAYICSACSGHGFKFSILMGRVMAALVLGEDPGVDLSRFRLKRFDR
jgi:glycine/D-amino acid oxidase-like deaminating enzyme